MITKASSPLRARLRVEVRDLLRSVGATAVMVTHDVHKSLEIVDYVYFIAGGKIAAAGIDLNREMIASCGSGLTACILSLARAATGREPARVYDGSWSEWGNLPDTPVQQ